METASLTAEEEDVTPALGVKHAGDVPRGAPAEGGGGEKGARRGPGRRRSGHRADGRRPIGPSAARPVGCAPRRAWGGARAPRMSGYAALGDAARTYASTRPKRCLSPFLIPHQPDGRRRDQRQLRWPPVQKESSWITATSASASWARPPRPTSLGSARAGGQERRATFEELDPPMAPRLPPRRGGDRRTYPVA